MTPEDIRRHMSPRLFCGVAFALGCAVLIGLLRWLFDLPSNDIVMFWAFVAGTTGWCFRSLVDV